MGVEGPPARRLGQHPDVGMCRLSVAPAQVGSGAKATASIGGTSPGKFFFWGAGGWGAHVAWPRRAVAGWLRDGFGQLGRLNRLSLLRLGAGNSTFDARCWPRNCLRHIWLIA